MSILLIIYRFIICVWSFKRLWELNTSFYIKITKIIFSNNINRLNRVVLKMKCDFITCAVTSHALIDGQNRFRIFLFHSFVHNPISVFNVCENYIATYFRNCNVFSKNMDVNKYVKKVKFAIVTYNNNCNGLLYNSVRHKASLFLLTFLVFVLWGCFSKESQLRVNCGRISDKILRDGHRGRILFTGSESPHTPSHESISTEWSHERERERCGNPLAIPLHANVWPGHCITHLIIMPYGSIQFGPL